MSDATIGTDQPLTPQQRGLLNRLLNEVIPADPELGMPGAGEIGLLDPGARAEPLLQAAAALLPALESGSGPDDEMLAQLAGQSGMLLQPFIMQVVVHYYRNARVLEALGLEPGPPFPRGNTIEAGDLSLLDPVRKREPLYRR